MSTAEKTNAKRKGPILGGPRVGPWKIGTAYLIRTVTMFVLGRVTEIYEQELVLEDASWVADTGRFHNALVTGKLNEVEPFPEAVIVGRGGIIDAVPWTHSLPREPK